MMANSTRQVVVNDKLPTENELVEGNEQYQAEPDVEILV